MVVVGLAAFATRTRGDALRLFLAVLLAGVVHAALGGLRGTPALLALAGAAGATAAGLAALGRRVGAGPVGAGVVASAVLWAAMSGVFWADDVAEALPDPARRDFRQAVVHLDLATACAYDAAGFDRLHDATVYGRVPLASTLIARPRAFDTALAWLALGLLLGLCAWRVPPAPDGAPAAERRTLSA